MVSKVLMERAIRTQGVEKILKEGTNHNTRREWKVMHGYRKWFNGVLVNANVNHTKKERLMGHDTGNWKITISNQRLMICWIPIFELLTHLHSMKSSD